MLKCREVAEESGDYIDRAMPWHRALMVRLHLLMCRHCRRFVDHLRMAVAYFRGLPNPELPQDEARRITEAVTKEAKEQEKGIP